METPTSIVQCPICYKRFPSNRINTHVNSCLGETEDVTVTCVRPKESSNKRKSESPPSQKGGSWSFMMTGKNQSKKAKHTLHDSKITDTVIIDDSSDDTSKQSTVSIKHRDVSVNNTSTRKDVFESKSSHFERNGNNFSLDVRASDKENEITALNSDPADKDLHVDIETLSMPLAEYMRPKSLDTYVGQEKAVGSTSILGSLLQSKYIPSLILWGPPGCGKTTLARIIAARLKEKVIFKKLSAVNSGVKDVNGVVKQAQNDRKMFRKGTVLFLDEIHRFNKIQQDSLLPHIEDGTITLIGATTENPSFQVNNALLSRCKVIVLEKLDCEAINKILITASERFGYHVFDTDEDVQFDSQDSPGTSPSVWIQKSAVEYLAQICDGDARMALNGLQMSVQSQISSSSQSKLLSQKTREASSSRMSHKELQQTVIIKLEHVKQSLQKTHIAYDKSGEEHYNMLSAFHKSIRGCADSAALYWLARMLEGGESPIVVARRMVACATEDIGIADPQALILAVAAFQTCQFLGMPECEKALAECAVYLACASKSVEVYTAYNKAKASIWEHEGPLPSVPLLLRNASNKFMKNLGYGKGYRHGSRDQQFLPECMKGMDFFKESST